MSVGRFAARVVIGGLFIGHGTQKPYWLVQRARVGGHRGHDGVAGHASIAA